MVLENKYTISQIIQRTPCVKSFRLQFAESIDFIAGQFMQVTIDRKEDLKRYLSFSSSPTEKGYIEFTKKITGSDFSTRLNSLKIGDKVEVKCPMGSFILKPEYQKIAFLSGGVGITPIRSMCKYLVDKKLDVDVVLLYANNTYSDIIFKEDFDLMQSVFKNFRVVYVLSKDSQPCAGSVRTGYITKDVIKETISDFMDRTFYVCGPPQMVVSLEGILSNEIGINKSKIVKENFIGY